MTKTLFQLEEQLIKAHQMHLISSAEFFPNHIRISLFPAPNYKTLANKLKTAIEQNYKDVETVVYVNSYEAYPILYVYHYAHRHKKIKTKCNL